MPLRPTPANPRHGLCLLSLDAGGARSVSQLKILAELMHRMNFGTELSSRKRPCDVFDMIAGVGSGGFITILLISLGLSADEALEELIQLSAHVLEKQETDPEIRTAALKQHITELIERYHTMGARMLMDPSDHQSDCKLVIPIAYKHHIGSPCILRNFESRQGQAVNLTIAEAMLATLATPPLFTSTSISKDAATFEYIGGDLALGNPTTELITQAYEAFGSERQVACILSVGCGHSGEITPPGGSDQANWNQFLEAILMNSERTAQTIDVQMGHLDLYHRFNVTRGLERISNSGGHHPGKLITHTSVYLADASISRKMDICVDLLNLRDEISSLEQLKRSGSLPVLASALPPLTKTFVMRKEPWEFAEKALLGPRESEEDVGQRILVVTGIGGCGKTQLMLKFLRLHSDRFISTCFVDGSSEARIRADIIRYVRSLGKMHSQMNFEHCLLVLSQESPERPRIIFYDNVDDPAIDIMSLLPNGDGCSIVITSRNRSIGAICPDTHLELDKMSMDEAVKLLLYSPNRFDLVVDQTLADARAVAEALDCLPIALQQARSYMRETGCSTKAYLERFRTSRDKLLVHTVKHHREMRYLSTYAAFDASFGKLYLRAQQLLQLLSFLHWHRFPLELVILAAKHSFSHYDDEYVDHGEFHHTGTAMLKDIFLVEGTWDLTNLDKLTAALQNYSLITLVPGVGTTLLEMHPLLHGWVNSSVPDNSRAGTQSAAIVLLTLGARSDYTPCEQYLSSHVMHLSPHWDILCINESAAFGVILARAGLYEGALQLQEASVIWLRQESSEATLRLLRCISKLAITYRVFGRLDKALALQEEILTEYGKLVGRRHPDTINVSNDLADTYSDLGRSGEALVLQKEVVELRREILGECHPDTITASNNLACSYSELGRFGEALELRKEVMGLRKEILGERHPNTITASDNLAGSYSELGYFDEALKLRKEVVELSREILGERHPDTITASGNLAHSYSKLGHFGEVLELQKKVVDLRGEILGERHPDTITASSNLACSYSELGRFDEALELQKKVVELLRETLGERHPDTITASNNLACSLSKLGRFDEALELRKKALELRREILGERHPDTITASNNLACSYSELGHFKEALELQKEVVELLKETLERGDFDKALELQKKVVKLLKEILGEHHPDTITASNNLTCSYSELGRFGEALELRKEVLELSWKILGKRHPNTITAASNLASSYSKLGHFYEALELQKRVVELRKKILGERHPDTITASNNLACSFSKLERFDEALELQKKALGLRMDILGERHPDTITASSNLASSYFELGRFDEALALRLEVLRLCRDILRKPHSATIIAMSNLAAVYVRCGGVQEKMELEEEILSLRKETLGDQHPETCEAMLNLSNAYRVLGRLPDALYLFNVADATVLKKLGNVHPLYKRCQSFRSHLQSDEGLSDMSSSLPPSSFSSNIVVSRDTKPPDTRSKVTRLVHKLKHPFS